MIKKIVSVILLASMIFCLYGCNKTPNKATTTPNNTDTIPPSTVGNGHSHCCGQKMIASTNLDECINAANTLKERGDLTNNFIGFDYDGDAFDIVYIVSTIGGHGGKDIEEFLTYDCIQFGAIGTYILLNDYTGCNCDDAYGHEGYGIIHQDFLTLTGIEPSVPAISIEADYDFDLPLDDFDSSLLTYEKTSGDYQDYTYEYCVKYNGTVIFRTTSCVPMDDEIWAMIVDSITVIHY